MARQSKSVRQAAILAHVRAGSTRRSAAALAGVPFATLYEWLEVAAFANAVTKAEAEFEQAAVQRIDRAARQGSWRAALALLERRLPDSWQQRSTLALEGDSGEITAEERAILHSIRDFMAKTPEEQIEQEQEQDRLKLESMGMAELRELHERIGSMLTRYPHIARVVAEPAVR